MQEHKQTIYSKPMPTTSVLGGLAMQAGDLGYLASDTVLIAIFASFILLLLGVLCRLRRLRTDLEKETQALEKSERHLKMMGDNLPNITIFQLIYDIDAETFQFTYISKGYERVLGLDRTHVMSNAQLALDHVYEADIPVLRKALLAGKRDMEPASIEIRVLDVSGTYKWLHISAIPQPIDHALVWDGFMQDISTMKDVEKSAAAENRNFQNLFETIDDFLLVCNMDGQIIHTNPAVERRLGYAHEKLGEMSIFELYPQEARSEIYRIIAQLQSEPSANCRLPMQTKDGSDILTEMNMFQGSWKRQQAIFGVARDVARFQHTESALRESQRMLQLIIDTIPMSIFWKDKDSVYLGCNNAFTHECRLENIEEVVGKTPFDLFDLFDRSLASTILERDQGVINTNQSLMSRLESHTRADGSIGWREVSLIPLRDKEGRAVGVLGVWRDVTEQNRAEERLKRTLDDMERFNQLMRGRERRTLELKSEINELLKALGQTPKYRTTMEDLT